jgi:hypothetical protein
MRRLRPLTGLAMTAVVACLPLTVAGGAHAQTPEDLCKGGQLAILRLSTLKSPAARETFDKATHDHMAWYRSHGYANNRQLVGSVLDFDPATKTVTASPNEVMTLHIGGPEVPRDKQDAAWASFVSEYRNSSDVTSTKIVCLREPVK